MQHQPGDLNDEWWNLVLLMGFVAGFVLMAMLSETAMEKANKAMRRWWGE